MFRNALRLSQILPEINPKRFAGHSKWANIRHIKGMKDAERASLFARLSRQMKVAVQEGGGSIDPNANFKLEQVIAQAKRANMPVATIQSVLKSTQTDKKQCKSYVLEIRGPGPSFVLCEVFTDSLHSVRQNMAGILRKNGSKFCEGIIRMFDEKGVILTEIKQEDSTKSEDQLMEKATDDAIEAGAEEVSLVGDNDTLEFICGQTNLKAVMTSLENNGYAVISASVEYIPHQVQSLSEKDTETYQNLHNRLDNLPEVTRICNNLAE